MFLCFIGGLAVGVIFSAFVVWAMSDLSGNRPGE